MIICEEIEKELSIEEMKTMANDIIKKELNSYGLNINVMPYTFVEYNGSRTLMKQTILDKTFKWIFAKNIKGAFNCKKNNIVIFLDNFKKMKKIDKQLFYLARTCYHESRHAIQMTYDSYSFDGFMNGIDSIDFFDYMFNHDSYLFEIDANINGTRKAKKYLMEKDPIFYENLKNEIDILEKIYDLELLTYDASSHIDAACSFRNVFAKLYKTEDNMFGDKYIKSYFERSKPALDIFFDANFNFRSLSDILKNKNFPKVDKKIFYAVFSSKSFLSTIDFSALSVTELEILKESLTYTCNLQLKQMKLRDQLMHLNNSLNMLMLKKSDNYIEKFKNFSQLTTSSFIGDLSNDFFHSYNFDYRNYCLTFIEKILFEKNNSSNRLKM